MPSRRVIDWQIKPGDKDNSYVLLLRNRTVLTDSSMTEINKHLRKHRDQGQTVHEVAEDGYATDVTRRLDRRHRPAQPASAPRRRSPVRMPLIRF
jgi:hypothetical protein